MILKSLSFQPLFGFNPRSHPVGPQGSAFRAPPPGRKPRLGRCINWARVGLRVRPRRGVTSPVGAVTNQLWALASAGSFWSRGHYDPYLQGYIRPAARGIKVAADPKNFDQIDVTEFGFFTKATRNLFHFAKRLSVMRLLSLFNSDFRSRAELEPAEVSSSEFVKRRARAIELYVSGWLLAEFVIVVLCCMSRRPLIIISLLLTLLVAIRIVEIVQVTVNATLFDRLTGRPDEVVATIPRMLVLAGINFVELLLCFGVIYAINYQKLVGAGKPITGIYLSIITQLASRT